MPARKTTVYKKSKNPNMSRYETGYKDNAVPSFGVFGWMVIVFLFSIAMLYIFNLPFVLE